MPEIKNTCLPQALSSLGKQGSIILLFQDINLSIQDYVFAPTPNAKIIGPAYSGIRCIVLDDFMHLFINISSMSNIYNKNDKQISLNNINYSIATNSI